MHKDSHLFMPFLDSWGIMGFRGLLWVSLRTIPYTHPLPHIQSIVVSS